MTATAMLEQIRLLPREEQAELAETILDDLAESDSGIPPLTQEQMDELDRRSAEYDADPSKGVPWEVVRARLHALIQ